MTVVYDPSFVPTGANTPTNEYYKKVNHVRLSKADSNKQEFFGTIGGKGIPEPFGQNS